MYDFCEMVFKFLNLFRTAIVSNASYVTLEGAEAEAVALT